MNQEQINKQIFDRLEKIERVVFGGSGRIKKKSSKNYEGPKGGIGFLLDKNLFPTKAPVSVVKELLEKYGYHYKREVIQTALNRFSKPGGLLVSFMENGKKVYAKRK